MSGLFSVNTEPKFKVIHDEKTDEFYRIVESQEFLNAGELLPGQKYHWDFQNDGF